MQFHYEEDYHSYLNAQPRCVGGAFKFWPENPDKKLIVPNTIVLQGENAFLKMLLQGDNTIVPAGGNFYIGLCGLNFGDTNTVLADGLAGEPTNQGGYLRQIVTRDENGWPPANLQQVNNLWKIATKVVNFTAVDADFSTAIRRAFLASTTDNTGVLFAVGGALNADFLIQNGNSFPAQYELYMK